MKINIPWFWILTSLFLWALAMREDLAENKNDSLSNNGYVETQQQESYEILHKHVLAELKEFFGQKTDVINS